MRELQEEQEVAYLDFKAGYMALLNELEFGGYNNTPQDMLMHKVYRLPEGVEK